VSGEYPATFDTRFVGPIPIMDTLVERRKNFPCQKLNSVLPMVKYRT